MSYITVVKPSGNKFLFGWVEGFDWSEDLSKRVESQGKFSFNTLKNQGYHFEHNVG